ncbi:MAG: hypothetical protein WEB58_06675 [Planctomycetaceae bacterium]|jgi:Tfp pilus assembly protein PilX
MIRRRSFSPGKPPHRRGVVVLVVLICLLFLSVVSVSLVKLALAERRQIQREAFRIQSVWLAEAGRQRALRQLSQDADYGGEQWEIALDGRPALVQTTIRNNPENAGERDIEITADYPVDPARRARVTKTSAAPTRLPSAENQQ